MMFSHQAMQREGGHFDNDFHMPDFDGLEGLNDIEQGFELHDIMSGNDGDFMLPCLEGGDTFYTTNPIQENHVNASQYPESSTTGSSSSSVGFEGIGSIAPSHMTPSVDQTTTFNSNSHHSDGDSNIHNVMSMFSTAEAPQPKIKWSGPLHTRFLKAVNVIGLEKITPKKVLKLMNVPGLTRRNVASHLQKYRLFLKRYADRNFPELRDRDKALNAAFLRSMPVLNSKQGATDISITYPLSYFRTLLGWRTRASFANLNESLYIHPSVTSTASNRGSTNRSAPVTHSNNGAVLPATRFMQNHHQNVSWDPRNHAIPFNPNPSNNGMIGFSKPPQVMNGNAVGFGSGQGTLGGQGIYKLNGFDISCFDTSRGATGRNDIAIPSTDQLGQANFSSNITQKEPTFGNGSLTPFFAVNGPPAFGKVGPNNPSCQVNNKMPFPQQGLEDACVINAAAPVPPAVQSASLPSNDLLDDDQIWSDEFVASLLEDIRPLLDELD